MPRANAWMHPPSNRLEWVGPVNMVYGYSQGWHPPILCPLLLALDVIAHAFLCYYTFNLIFYIFADLQFIMTAQWWLDNPAGRTLKDSIQSIPYQIGRTYCMQCEFSVCITIPCKYKRADIPDLYLIEQDKYDWVEVGQGDTYNGMGPAYLWLHHCSCEMQP